MENKELKGYIVSVLYNTHSIKLKLNSFFIVFFVFFGKKITSLYKTTSRKKITLNPFPEKDISIYFLACVHNTISITPTSSFKKKPSAHEFSTHEKKGKYRIPSVLFFFTF